MRKIFNSNLFFKMVGLTSFSLSVYNTIGQKKLVGVMNGKIDRLTESNRQLVESNHQLNIEVIKVQHNFYSLLDKGYNIWVDLNNHLSLLIKRFTELNALPDDKKGDGLEENFVEIDENLDKAIESSEKLLEIFNRKSGNKVVGDEFLSEIMNILNDFNNYMYSLPIEQHVAMTTILGCFIICLSLMSILSVLFGNFIVDYFKIDERYPRLKKYFDLRLKLQRFYLILDFSIIIFVLIGIVIMNLVILL